MQVLFQALAACVWCLGITASLLAVILRQRQVSNALFAYGKSWVKLNDKDDANKRNVVIRWLVSMLVRNTADIHKFNMIHLSAIINTTVPKSWFTAFYAFAAFNTTVALFITHSCVSWIHVLPLALFLLHSTRRLLECVYVHRFSVKSRMPLHLWASGLLHYACVPITLFPVVSPTFTPHIGMLIAFTALFVVGNVGQYYSHVQFAELRVGDADTYSYPTGKMFRISLSPHYTMEILIYTGLAGVKLAVDGVLAGESRWILGFAPVLMLLWVACNLTASALRTKQWYIQHFPDRKAEILRRPAILPCI